MDVSQSGRAVNLTASGHLTYAEEHLLGFYVNSTGGGTVIFRDGGPAGGAISGTITPVIGWHPYRAESQQTTGLGLYAEIAGTINITFFVDSSLGYVEIPFKDLGGGAVDTTFLRGIGAPTFARATTKWTKLSTGLWGSVASGIAASSYLGANTAVGAYGGYFAEAAGIQLVTPTASIRDMTNAAWVKTTMTAAKTAIGIDGVANSASRVTATGATATILQTLVAAATSRTYSCWVRRVTGTGTILLKQNASSADITALINSTTYTRVSLNASVLDSVFGIQINTNGDAIDVDFNQFEAGAFATSPMDSAGAARNADALSYPSAGNVSGLAGAVYAEATIQSLDVAANQNLISIGTGTPLYARVGSTLTIGDGTTEVQSVNTLTSATPFKGASSWGVVLSVCLNGGAVATGAFDGNMDLTGFNIGSNVGASANFLGGTIKNVKIWQAPVQDAQLQAMTR